jgi:glycosyltransferase involved in cell wall biosynthesis
MIASTLQPPRHTAAPAPATPVLFVQTSMPVGGAETLLVNLVRRLDKRRFAPEVVCLKERGPLGERLAEEGYPVHHGLLSGKFDLRVMPRLVSLCRRRGIRAVVTVGAGDKMFWGRLAAKRAGVPVIASALHSTGWPDGVGRLNRWLTPVTDAFIAVAEPHGRFLVEFERFPEARVCVIPNGVDVERFAPGPHAVRVRQELRVGAATPLVGILAALRPEKNHELFLGMAKRVLRKAPEAVFVVIGDGPRRADLERLADGLGMAPSLRFLGNRDDIPEVLRALDVLTLTSHNEANPVSILEGMACGKPIVATDVGSVAQSVHEGRTGHLTPPGDEALFAERVAGLLLDPLRARAWGDAGRKHVVETASLDVMVRGYERLLTDVYQSKTGRAWPGGLEAAGGAA